MTKFPEKIPYRADIDGLRAIAIALVVLFHAGIGCDGGFAGVDVFFVISGFLITGILLRELEGGTFSMVRFWQRRVRRLFPVLMVFLVVTLAAGSLVLLPPEMAGLGDHSLATLLSAVNFRLQSTVGYWAPQADHLPLLHMWSLAVEEQFYLLLPPLLVLGQRRLRKHLGTALVLVGGLSLAYSLMFQQAHPKPVFFLLPGRAWELLIGGITSYGMRRGFQLKASLAPPLAWLGLGMILVPAFTLQRGVAWPGLPTLLPTLGTALLIAVNGTPNGVARLLALPPVRFVGLISYSLYLWHWPAIVFMKLHRYPAPASAWDIALALAAAVALAALTWRFVERPFRYRPGIEPRRNRLFFAGITATWAVVAVTGFVVLRTGGFEELFYRRLPASARLMQRRPGRESFRRYNATAALERGGMKFNCGGQSPRVVVIGSSHGMMLGSLFESLSTAHHVPLAMLTQDGTPGLFAGTNTHVTARGRTNVEKRRRDGLVRSWIAAWQPQVVFVTGRWEAEASNSWAGDPGESLRAFERAFVDTLRWLTNHGAQVVVVGQVPLLPLPNDDITRAILVRYLRNGCHWPVFVEHPEDTARRSRAGAVLAARKDERVQILDLQEEFLHPDGSIRYYNAETILYQDDDHLNRVGALELKHRFDPFFIQVTARATQATRKRTSTQVPSVGEWFSAGSFTVEATHDKFPPADR